MQDSIPQLMDAASEGQGTFDLYGCQVGDGSFASNCLLARRLVERGVRFIQLYHKDWDHHGGVKDGVELKAKEIDRPCAALIKDLKARGLWNETLLSGPASSDARPCRKVAMVATITTKALPFG